MPVSQQLASLLVNGITEGCRELAEAVLDGIIRKARKLLRDAGHTDEADSLTAVLRAAHLDEADEPDEPAPAKKLRTPREIAAQVADLQRYAEQYPSVA